MDKKSFRQRVEGEILILDGVYGTMLQPYMPPGACIDRINIDEPDLVCGIYSAYAKAGADIVSTNTFGANRVKLLEYGLSEKTREINYTAAKSAKKTVGDRIWVAGCIGPTGKLVEPIGEISFDETYNTFREQVIALAEGGVDLFLLETFSDLKEIKIAVLAVIENTDLPVMASMTYDESYTSFLGTDPVTAANVLVSLGVDAVGVNCSTGPESMLEVLGRYAQTTDCPLFLEPNAGIPQLENEKTTYQIMPVEMADFGEKFVALGANIVGTCCGSTPDYTAELRKRLKGKRPVSRKVDGVLKLSSRVRTVEIGSDFPFCVIGERINPTNREDMALALREKRIDIIQREAQAQVREGAHLLDVNIGLAGLDEPDMMGRVVRTIENAVETPLSIDSVNPSAIETALRESAGKVLVNSVNGEEKRLNQILPLIKRFGTGVLCLAVGEEGIPKTAEERVSVLKKIVRHAEKVGIAKQNMICDCLTLTVSAQQKRAEETLRAIRMVKEELDLPVVLGVSNISYGLPDRSFINAAFLSMAMGMGLDAAIMNPGDKRMMETVRAASVLTVRDKDSKAFVKNHLLKRKGMKKVKEVPSPVEKEDQKVFDAVMTGKHYEIGTLVEERLRSGKSALYINEEILIPAIQEVGKKFDRKEIYLPQMILTAETMQRAFAVLEPHFDSSETISRGTILLCTVKGDVHDIGKNIVGLFLKNQGFRVIDLGKDVSAETIATEAVEQNADVVGLSALMTTTMVEMLNVITKLRAAGSRAKVIVGGAVVTKKYAEDIGADGYAKDGVSAVDVVKTLVTK